MDRKTAASTLRQIAGLLELSGENRYRVRAFTGAARAVETTDGDLDELVSSGRVVELKGVGKGTAAVLAELAAGRRPRALVDAEEAVPPGVREMLKLAGLGPKKVRALWRGLGVENLGELEYACRENRLVDLKGFGAATQSSVLDSIGFLHRSRERRLIHQAWADAGPLIARISSGDGVADVAPAGELRRMGETVGELSLVVTLRDGAPEEEAVATVGGAERIAPGQWLHRPEEGLAVRLWFASSANHGSIMLQATGSDEFLSGLGLSSAVGLKGGEEAVLRSLGFAWIPPELRDDGSWLERARRDDLPNLVEDSDIRGVLHNHTTDSDGAATLEEMAAAAADRGWEFFGVADHSPVAVYANGVDGARLRDQWSRADEWNAVHRELRIVKGIEADIMADGSLDIPEGCESGLDYVVASVHSAFRQSEEAQTERLVAAVAHPACRVLGHPTGRLLLARPGYAVDMERVLDACAEHGVAVEINASPYRLDLDRKTARLALDRGIRLAVNPDAHSVDGLDAVSWGLAVARGAGATDKDLVNAMDIEKWLLR
ncbi:MAG: PHP domain-containing protein [Thermoanaerobaculales bacterium]|jgi:DNA polymerase (family 10)|nr:PHP domain-containing protein [Thermoanaerobaculales bacterium]